VGSRRAFIATAAAAVAVLAELRVLAQPLRWTTDSAVGTVGSLHEGLIAASRGASTQDRFRRLEPLIAATHDLPYIAEFALRRQWSSLAEADRQQFVAAFERLSVTTYAARFKAVGVDTFRPMKAEPPDASGRIQVRTAIARADQPDVSLEYLLQRDGENWKIINVIADGVSDLALKRAEYQRVFASGGIAGLIAELEQQTERLERN
jgi:phospholipid transport system substrate-binding protein